MHLSPKMSRWTLTCSPWVCRPSGGCVTCCLLEKAEREWGAPPWAGPFGRRGFFRAFSAHFCVTLEHLFFKCQNVEEKWAENLRKNGRKNLCNKNLRENGRKNVRTKNLRKNGRKNLRTKNPRKKPVWTFRVSGRWKPEKKHKKKICAKLAQNPSPKALVGRWAQKSPGLGWRLSREGSLRQGATLSQNLFCNPVLDLLDICQNTQEIRQTGVHPYPLGTGQGASDAESPSCIGFTVLRRGLRPWSRGPDHAKKWISETQ